MIEHTCQRLIFNNFNFILPRHFLNLLRKVIFSFCKDNRGRTDFRLIFQCYGKMRRVRDDHIRLGHILHHSLLGYLLHFTALPSFDLRISLCIFVFIFYFLLGHLHIFIKLMFLIDKVSQTNHKINNTDFYSRIDNQSPHKRNRLIQSQIIQRKQIICIIFYGSIRDIYDNHNL